jgi:hypothetical protein
LLTPSKKRLGSTLKLHLIETKTRSEGLFIEIPQECGERIVVERFQGRVDQVVLATFETSEFRPFTSRGNDGADAQFAERMQMRIASTMRNTEKEACDSPQ